MANTQKFLEGLRIQGRSDDSIPTAVPQTSWKELGRYTLTGEADTINVGSGTQSGGDGLGTGDFALKDNLMILCYIKGTGDIHPKLQFNGDTSTSYASRVQTNGSAWLDPSSGTTGATAMRYGAGTNAVSEMIITTVRNILNEEKLCITTQNFNTTTGAGTAPASEKCVTKWTGSAVIKNIQIPNSQTGGFVSGSQVIVLGCDDDEADSGTNFWQQLAEDTTTGSVASLDVEFTAKKWLMFDWDVTSKSSSTFCEFRANLVAGSTQTSTYASGFQNNLSGYDTTRVNNSDLNIVESAGTTTPTSCMSFVYNDANLEKLGISTGGKTNGNSSATPLIDKVWWKWANTSVQISDIQIKPQSGTIGSGSTLRVWGAD